MDKIVLNDLLRIQNLENVKIRLNLMFRDNWNPIEEFKNGNIENMLEGQYWNYNRNKSFQIDQITIGFVKINSSDDLWLLFHIGKVTKDLEKLNGIGYEFEELEEYKKYFGRLVVRYKNSAQNMIRKAKSIMDDCYVEQILPDTFDDDLFPGYENINLSWKGLSRVLGKETWKTALQNQKGVYLISDSNTGKFYVGSAYGNEMILGRWQTYVKNGHGGNVGLKKLSFEYIKENFRYSVLDIYKSTVDDKTIIERESWWKTVLYTRKFGYNEN